MNYVHLGRTGLKVSRLCLGTMNFGPQTSEADSFAIGPRTIAQLEGALRALDQKLDDPTLKELDTLFPGPGGPAPEAYAW